MSASKANTNCLCEFVQSVGDEMRRGGVASAGEIGPIVMETFWLAKAARVTGVNGKLHCNCAGNPAQEKVTVCGELGGEAIKELTRTVKGADVCPDTIESELGVGEPMLTVTPLLAA